MLSHRLSRGVHLIALAVASRGFMFPFPTSVRQLSSSRGPSARPRPRATPPHRRGGAPLRAGDPDVRAAQELRERECAALDGVIAVHKPRGPSSARVVAIVRNRLEKEMKARTGVKTKVKVGHGGTLDPLATGVLVLGIGKVVSHRRVAPRVNDTRDDDATFEWRARQGNVPLRRHQVRRVITARSARALGVDRGAV